MRFNTLGVPTIGIQRKRRPGPRQRAAALILPVLLAAGCSGGGTGISPFGGSPSEDFVGGVVGDEPQAVLVGQEILRKGGSAADAAVATYFAMAVTYPNAAALGGGGACVAFDAVGKRMESLTFLPTTPAAGGPIAVPGNLRGMVALQARHGKLRWSAVVSPAESLARFGFAMSRALARAVHEQGQNLLVDAGAGRLAVDVHGRPLQEGDKVVQPELAEYLSTVRVNPLGESTEMIADLAANIQQAGGSVAVEDLTRNGGEWRAARVIPWSEVNIGLPDTEGGRQVQRLWEQLDEGSAFIGAAGEERAAILADALRKVYGDSDDQAGIPEHASTGILTMDKHGSGVACAFTMGKPFGAKVTAGKTGILLAAAPPAGHGYENGLVPMVGVNRPFLAIRKSIDTLYFLSAGTAETAAGPNQLATILPLFEDKITIDQALSMPRIRDTGGAIEYENGLPGSAVAAMRSRSLSAHPVDVIGYINVVYCPDGFKSSDSTSCQFRADRRSFGLVARGE